MTLWLLIMCGASAATGVYAALLLMASLRGVPLTQVINSSAHILDGGAATCDPANALLRGCWQASRQR